MRLSLPCWFSGLFEVARPIRSASSRPQLEILEDRRLLTDAMVTSAGDSADPNSGTLRAALGKINSSLDATNTITFQIGAPGSMPPPIMVNTPLPPIVKPVVINGLSQGGIGYQGPPLIILDGLNLPPLGADGLLFNGDSNSTVRGLVIRNFKGNGIHITNSTNIQIIGNDIGTDPSGTTGIPNGTGVLIDVSGVGTSMGNIIGGTAPGAANVISGNTKTGVEIQGAKASDNVVLGNFIGTNQKSATNLGNKNDGVLIDGGATGNIIGGTAQGSANIIFANGTNGVEIAGASSNTVQGNFIGTNQKSATNLPGNKNDGVLIDDANGAGASTGNIIGGTIQGSANVISANGQNGIEITGAKASKNLVQSNFIGTDKTGTQRLGNTMDGVLLMGDSSDTISAGNIISANGGSGVEINGGMMNVIQGNFIGTDKTGTLNLGNKGMGGVYIQGGAAATNNSVGGAAGPGNFIAFNTKGVVVGAGVTGTSILHNSIFANKGKGIDLAAPVQTPPTIDKADVLGIRVSFVGVGGPGVSYLLEIYLTPLAQGPNMDQGKNFLTAMVFSVGVTNFPIQISIPPGQVVTATVTKIMPATEDTSEFSAGRVAHVLVGRTWDR